MSPIDRQSPPRPARSRLARLALRPVALLPFALLLGAAACGPAETQEEPSPGANVLTGADHDANACDAEARRPGGGCCAAGSFYHADTDACLAVGPPECAAQVFAEPAACVPRWCWDWRDDGDVACGAGALDCLPVGRRCSAEELAAGVGCPAGSGPASMAQPSECVPAGLLATSPWHVDDEAAPPPLAALPASAPPRWCLKSGLATPCAAPSAGCPAGEGPAAEQACAPAGLPWVCPPGFVVDAKAPAEPTGLAVCAPDPAACGAGPWSQNLPTSGVLYVDPSAGAGGDGSAANPLSSLGAAVAAAQSGQTVALAAGTFAGALQVGKALHIVGRCAALSRIDGGGALAMVRVVSGAKLTLTDVTVSGEGIGVLATGSGQAVLERVMIKEVRTAGAGAIASGATLTLRDSLIVGTRPSPQGTSGRGAEASAGGSLVLQRVRISRQRDVGLLVTNAGSVIDAEAVLVDDTRAVLANGARGRAVEVNNGGRLQLVGARLVGFVDAGLRVATAGAEADVKGLRVEGWPKDAAMKGGGGVLVQGGGQLNLQGAVLQATVDYGLAISGGEATARVGGLAVVGTQDGSGPGMGQGVQVDQGGWLELVGADLSANHGAGLAVIDAGSLLYADQVRVRDTLPSAQSGGDTAGMHVGDGGVATLRNARFSGNRGYGLAVHGQGALATVSEALIEGGALIEGQEVSGVGAAVLGGGELRLSASRVHGNSWAGLVVSAAGSLLRGEGLVVDGTLSTPATGDRGHGVLVYDSGRLELRHSRLSANHEQGLAVEATGTLALLDDVLVDNSVARPKDGHSGHGVVVFAGARLTANHLRVYANRSAGIGIAHVGSRARLAGLRADHNRAELLDGSHGNGLVVNFGGHVTVAGGVISANRVSGAFAGRWGSTMTLVGCRVVDTAANDADNEYGFGVASAGGADLTVLASVVAGNHAGGILMGYGTGHVAGSVIRATGWAGLRRTTGEYPAMGDGVIATESKAVFVGESIITDNRRAGVFAQLTQSPVFSALAITDNLFGVVADQATYTIDKPLAVQNNTQANMAADLGLVVPKAPALAAD